MHRFVGLAFATFAALLPASVFAQNLLRNGSFEATPCVTPCNQGPWVMPSDWLSLVLTPSTYSNDGSYGLSPDAYGNFTGATAQDGLRWIAAWTTYTEIPGQVLSAPLEAGRSYVLTAYLREAVRSDIANPGTYQVELWASTDPASTKVVLGAFAPPIANQSAWEQRTLTFTAPADAQNYPVMAFRPLASTKKGAAYPGMDNVVLVADTGGGGGGGGQCTGADVGARILIGDCETGVLNINVGNSCTLSDKLNACQGAASNHGGFVSCVATLTNSLQKQNLITGLEKGQIQSCAGQARVP